MAAVNIMIPVLPFLYVVLCVPQIQGVSAKIWRVTFTDDHICAVNGSSAVMPCSFTHPPDQTVTKLFWTIKPQPFIEPTDLLDMPDYKDRVEYSPDKHKNCTLTLRQVKLADAGEYHPRIITNQATRKWLQNPGISLTVTGLSVLIPGPAIEGSEVKMNCRFSCSVKDNLTVIWRKNGEDLLDYFNDLHNDLILANVSTEDEGYYSCALRGFEGYPSTPVKLDVIFAPKNTSMSVRPSQDVSVGDTVTLACSSDANPPVENYTWFKVGVPDPVGSGQQYSITNISSEDGGQYYCVSRNKYGAKTSSPVLITVNVQGGEEKRYIASAIIGVIVAAIVGISCAIHFIRIKTKEKIVVQSHPAGTPSAEGATDVCLYSTLQPHGTSQTGDILPAQEDEVLYSIVYFSKHGERVTVRPDEALNTIYCNAQHRT